MRKNSLVLIPLIIYFTSDIRGAQCHKKPQMSVPGPFFKPHCRGINLPMMDGFNSTHGEIDYVVMQQKV